MSGGPLIEVTGVTGRIVLIALGKKIVILKSSFRGPNAV
jgi:hypothetical protein